MDADYKRLCGEIWDALGVPPNQQQGEPTEKVKKLVAAGQNVVETFSNKDKVGWSPSKLRNAVVDLMHELK